MHFPYRHLALKMLQKIDVDIIWLLKFSTLTDYISIYIVIMHYAILDVSPLTIYYKDSPVVHVSTLKEDAGINDQISHWLYFVVTITYHLTLRTTIPI